MMKIINFPNTERCAKEKDGKPMPHLVPSSFIFALIRVFEYGLKKYGEDTWRKGLCPTDLYDAAMRHMLAINNDEMFDMESTLPHAWHAAWNMLMLDYMETVGPDKDEN